MLGEKKDHYWKDNVEINSHMFYFIFMYPYMIALGNFPFKTFRMFMVEEKYLLFEIYLLFSLISHCKTMKSCQKPNHMVEFQIHKMNNSWVTYCVVITEKPGKAKKVIAPSFNINDNQSSTWFQSHSKFDWSNA